MGANVTLNEVRSQYWIYREKQVINQIMDHCKVLQGPPSPDLPTYRIASEFAFTKIGLDHAGPHLVKNIYIDDNDMHKAYIGPIYVYSRVHLHEIFTWSLHPIWALQQ